MDDPTLHDWHLVHEGIRNEWQCSRCLFRRLSRVRPLPTEKLGQGVKSGGLSCDELIVRDVQLS